MRAKTSGGRDFQDQVLGRLLESRQITTIYLRNRMSLRGRVIRFDPYVVLLDPLDGTPPQLVYKSAMVSISGPRMMPGPPGARRPAGARPMGGPRPNGPYPGPRPNGPRPFDGPRHEGARFHDGEGSWAPRHASSEAGVPEPTGDADAE